MSTEDTVASPSATGQVQFSQSPATPTKIDLGQQYKSIGISAVQAAAAFTRRKPEGGQQMG